MTASAALLALVLAAPAPSASPFRDCEATQIRHGWQYRCGGVSARVEDLREGEVDVKSHLAGLAAAAPALVGEGAVTRVERRKLGREEVEVRITGSPERFVLVAALPRPAGTRVLACAVERSLSCDAALGWLATVPWRGGRAPGSRLVKPPPLQIAGRPVQVPPGCEATSVPNGGSVRCRPAFFANWVALDDEQGRRMFDAFGPATRERLEQHGLRTRQDDTRCLLAGAPTTCGRLTIEAEGRAIAVMLWASAPVGSQSLFASCQGPIGTPIASPCSLVFRAP